MKKIGIVGCGAIGTEIARAIDAQVIRARLSHICDTDAARTGRLADQLSTKPSTVKLAELISNTDIVVESAGQNSVKEITELCIKHTKTVLVMSVGYFLKDMALFEKAGKHKGCVILPSGALAGMDAVSAARLAHIDSATLTTTKPPRGLRGAPYLEEHNIDLDTITGPTVVFEGSAIEAVKAFPANINVSAVLSFAGAGPEKTTVKIIADPHTDRNTHEVEILGDSGRIYTRTENVPSPTNPKTSYLAVLSAIAVLKQLCD
ncbi:MAG: aspartate dehydrogenase [bacterium]